MKKSLFDTVAAMVPDSKNVHAEHNNYIDTYFNSGFSCPGVFVGFDFFVEDDRRAFSDFLRAIGRKKTLTVRIVKQSYCVAGVTVWNSADVPALDWIESEKAAAVAEYWNRDHALRVAGVSDNDRRDIMRKFYDDAVRAFQAKYNRVVRIA